MSRHLLFVSFGFMAALLGCSERETPASLQTPSPPAALALETPVDACSLLTTDEIQAVQGEPVQSAKPSGRSDAGLAVSQCYFTVATLSNSISLTLVQKGAAGGRSPGDAWRAMFPPEKLREMETAEGKKKLPPLRVPDLGDEAFWVGSELIGALHVLKDDRYLTISVGGSVGQATKMERSIALARAALARLN